MLTNIFLQSIYEKCSQILSTVTTQTETLVNAVKEAIDSKAWESGHMTSDRLSAMLSLFKEQMLDAQKRKFDEIRVEFRNIVGGSDAPPIQGEAIQDGTTHDGGCTFCYGGRMHDVPEGFEFPKKLALKSALRFWLCGQTVGEGNDYVKPFLNLKVTMLPNKKIQNEFKLQWKGVFKLLEDAEEVDLPAFTRRMSQEEIDQVYIKFVSFLRSKYSYCFRMARDPHINWSIGTWGVRTRRSEVMKHGSAVDIAALPRATRRNEANGRRNKRKRQVSENILYPHRRQAARNREEQADQEQFARAFSEIIERGEQRDEDILTQVEQQIRRESNVTRIIGNTDGTALHINERQYL